LQQKIKNILQQDKKIIKEQKKLAKEIKLIDQQLKQLPIELQQEQQLPYHWFIFTPTENEQKYLGKKLKSL